MAREAFSGGGSIAVWILSTEKLDWPGEIPDFNLIEYVWDKLEHELGFKLHHFISQALEPAMERICLYCKMFHFLLQQNKSLFHVNTYIYIHTHSY